MLIYWSTTVFAVSLHLSHPKDSAKVHTSTRKSGARLVVQLETVDCGLRVIVGRNSEYSATAWTNQGI